MSPRRPLLIGAFLLAACLVVFQPSPYEKLDGGEILFAEPLLFKALSGNSANLNADFLWLLSNNISEIKTSGKVDTEKFSKAFLTIATVEPNFFPAINYGALYLASVKNEVVLAEQIVDTSLQYSPNNINTLFLKLLLNISYKEIQDEHLIYETAKKIAAHENATTYLKKTLIKNFAQDVLIYSKNSKIGTAQKIKDLQWLYENSEDRSRKKEITEAIEKLKG